MLFIRASADIRASALLENDGRMQKWIAVTLRISTDSIPKSRCFGYLFIRCRFPIDYNTMLHLFYPAKAACSPQCKGNTSRRLLCTILKYFLGMHIQQKTPGSKWKTVRRNSDFNWEGRVYRPTASDFGGSMSEIEQHDQRNYRPLPSWYHQRTSQ